MAVAFNFPAIRPSLNLDFANARALDPRITFSRASAATYYDGKTVAKAEENLWFPSAPIPSGGTATINTANAGTAPDGTQTAGFSAPDSTTANHLTGYKAVQLVAAEQVFSFYAKAAGYESIRVGDPSSSRMYASFDLSALSVTNTGGVSYVSAGISDIGNGWRRCWIKFNLTGAASASSISATPFPTGGAVNGYGQFTGAGDGVSGAYLWGFQLEQRSQVTAYTPTTTQPITNYIPVLQTALAGVPRFDHNPMTGESLGLLVEEQRTNLLTYSEQFSNAAWTKNSCSIAANTLIAPDGTLSADKVIEDLSSPVSHDVRVVGTQVTEYTVSVYAKAGERKWLKITNATGGVCFDLGNGVVGSYAGTGAGSAAIFNVGNGWYRCSVKLPSITSGAMCLIGPTPNDATLNYAGDGVSGVYIWGAQLEAGAFPTSYIKTDASQVTRAADSAQMTGSNFSSWYQQGEGSLIAEARNIVGATVFSTAVLTDDQALQTNNRLALFNRPSGVSGACALISYGNSEQISNGFIFKEINKIAIAYKNNDVTAALNGSTSTQDILANIPAFTKLRIGQLTAGSDFFATQTIKRLTYYPKRLTDAQLQALTA